MKLTRTRPIAAFIDALEAIKKHPGLLALSAFFDALFFLAYGIFTGPISDRVVEQSIMITNELGKQWAAGLKSGLLKLLFLDPVKQYTGKLLMYLALLFLMAYVVYCMFQAVTWHLALRTTGHAQGYLSYLRGFARVNLIWVAGYVLYRLLDIVIDLRFVLVKKFQPGAINILGFGLDALFFVLVLAAIASYPNLREKTLFRTRLADTIGFILISLVIILNAQFFTNQLSKLFLLPNISQAASYVMLFLLGTFFALFINLIKIYTVEVYGKQPTVDRKR